MNMGQLIILMATIAMVQSTEVRTPWQRKGAAVRGVIVTKTTSNKQLYRWAAVDPYRIIAGKECDLRPYFAWLLSDSRAPNPMPLWGVMYGKIIQTTANGILLQLHEDRVVFVKQFPRKLADGTVLHLAAVKESDPYSYVDVQGVERNIDAYNYGKPITAKIDESKTK